jgi:hypothetical protein
VYGQENTLEISEKVSEQQILFLVLREHAANLDEIVACLENWRLPKGNI